MNWQAIYIIIGALVLALGGYLTYLAQYHSSFGGDNPNYFSGWTRVFAENQVLSGVGGTMSLYDSEVAPGFQVFVHIPKERVLRSEQMRDGDGRPYVAVTVRPP
jgi:hypothetical protein